MNCFHCYLIKEATSIDWPRERIINEIRKKSYPAFSGSCSEIYLEKCFFKKGIHQKEKLVNANKLGSSSLMFLVHPTITITEMNSYAEAIKEVLLTSSK